MRRILPTMWCVKEEGDDEGDKKENDEKIEVGDVEMTEQNDCPFNRCSKRLTSAYIILYADWRRVDVEVRRKD